MRHSARFAGIVFSLLLMSGCLAPWSIRLPTVFNRSPEVERRAQEYHDPYPDSQLGPSTGFRPLQYDQQRPLPIRVREKEEGTRFRGSNGLSMPAPVGNDPGSQYPAVVPF